MELTNLSKIGLTPGEIKIYIALIQYGELSKSPLANKASVSSSKVYDITGRLIKKGLIGSFKKNNITYYTANDPILIEEYIEKKEKELEKEKEIVKNILPKLQGLKKISEEKVSFELQEGWKGVENALIEGLKKTPKNGTIYGLGMQIPQISLVAKFHRERIKRKIKLKMIISSKPEKTQDYKDTQIRFSSEESTGVSMGIYADRVLIQSLGEPPINLVMKHPRIVNSFKKIYDILWNQSSKTCQN